jgi:hypothetical protein
MSSSPVVPNCLKCVALECLAKGIHFATGNTGGYQTTSACYVEKRNTIYVTSQIPNQTFFSIPMLPANALSEAERALAEWCPNERVSAAIMGLKEKSSRSRFVNSKRPTMRKVTDTVSNVWLARCFGAGAKVFLAYDDDRNLELDGDKPLFTEAGLECYKALFQSNPALKVVFDADIFAEGVSAAPGFHAESRLIRYLFISYLRKDMEGSLLNSTQKTTEQWNGEFKQWFAERRIHMGSSLAACTDCAECMGKLGICYVSKTDNSAATGVPWIHPLYLSSKPEESHVSVARSQAEYYAQQNKMSDEGGSTSSSPDKK